MQTNKGMAKTTLYRKGPKRKRYFPQMTGKELNLLGALDTPVQTDATLGETSQMIVPTALFNDLVNNQQNLVNLIKTLSTQVKTGGTNQLAVEKLAFQGTSHAMTDDALVTQGELRHLLQTERKPNNVTFDLEPPLSKEVLGTPYLNGYQPPSFRKFDGIGSAREHLMSFLDDLEIHRNNKELRLKEFSKSLSGRAITWYVKLRPNSIKTWEELAAEFCGKFLEEEGALHIMDLGRLKQKAGETLLTFIKRYRDRAFQCKETLPEADLVYGCIKNIEDGSQIFLNLGGITTFAELMKKAADVADTMKWQGKRAKEAESMFDICALEERERKKAFKGSFSPRKNATYSHTTMDCWTIRRAFHKQVKLGKVLLPGDDGGELHKRPLPNHAVNMIAPFVSRLRIEEIQDNQSEEEEILTTGLAKTKGFRVLFGQLGLNQRAQKEAAKAIVQVVRTWGGDLSAMNAPLTRMARAHASALIFREPADLNPQFCHNRPLYMEATVEGVKVRRALVDNGSGVNILPTYLFEQLNIPRRRVRSSEITLSTFHGEAVESQGCVNVMLEVGPIRTFNVF
ncbi:Retrotransposon gag domain [Sesbania bispinosa]|nr:Retrotransposon gag domain [Sesbania bispinosa]